MNALLPIPSTSNDPANAPHGARNSLWMKCRNVRWEFLQRFAVLEQLMTDQLKSGPGHFFGKKADELNQHFSNDRAKDAVVEARNLVAHAEISIFFHNLEAVSYWRMPKCRGGTRSHAMTFDEIERWESEITGEVDKVCLSLKATA